MPENGVQTGDDVGGYRIRFPDAIRGQYSIL